MHRLFKTVLTLAAVVAAGYARGDQSPPLNQSAAQQFLQNLAGTWYGTYRIRTPDARTLDRVEVEEHYAWDKADGRNILRGRAVMHSSGRLNHSSSQTWIEDGKLLSKVKQGEQVRRYRGEVTADGTEVSWRQSDAASGNRLSQKLTMEDKRDTLVVSGYEDYQHEGVGTLLMIDAKLYREADEVSLPSPRREY